MTTPSEMAAGGDGAPTATPTERVEMGPLTWFHEDGCPAFYSHTAPTNNLCTCNVTAHGFIVPSPIPMKLRTVEEARRSGLGVGPDAW
jgi:hypothetical protein